MHDIFALKEQSELPTPVLLFDLRWPPRLTQTVKTQFAVR